MSIKINKIFMALMLLPVCTAVKAQIGEHRSDFSVGANVGYTMSSVGFTPKVTQSMLGGMTAGLQLAFLFGGRCLQSRF